MGWGWGTQPEEKWFWWDWQQLATTSWLWQVWLPTVIYPYTIHFTQRFFSKFWGVKNLDSPGVLWTLNSIHNWFLYLILFYYLKKLFYQLYHIILQYIQYLNFYFSILLIKIIFLHNKIHFIIKIIFSYSTLSLK